MVVPGPEVDLELDPPEERRGRVEDDAVGARVGVGELPDPPVRVGLAGPDEIVLPPDLDAHAGNRHAALGVEDVGGDGQVRLYGRSAVEGPSAHRARAGTTVEATAVQRGELRSPSDVGRCDDRCIDKAERKVTPRLS